MEDLTLIETQTFKSLKDFECCTFFSELCISNISQPLLKDQRGFDQRTALLNLEDWMKEAESWIAGL